MLKEITLYGEVDKVKTAIERLKAFEPKEGYYLAFSGGKDSICIYHLAKLAGVKFDAHYSVTTIDAPDVIKCIKKSYADVIWDRPKNPLLSEIVNMGTPPLRQARWCCRIYKENGGDGRVVLTGIRWEESNNRGKRKMTEQCLKGGNKSYVHPIIDWTEEDVWEFIKQNNLPYPNIYDKGFKRVGCMFCPMSTKTEKKLYADMYPQYVKTFINSFDRCISRRLENGKECSFKTGKEWFNWWCFGEGSKDCEGQQMMFD